MSHEPSNLCILPWIHLNLAPDGFATLCCQSGTLLRDEGGKPLNAQTHTLEAIWNSRAMREVRVAMLRGEALPHCAACARNERHGWGSSRQSMNQLWFGSAEEAARDPRKVLRDSLTEAPLGPPRYFDLRIGNLCNLKCVICRPLYSSSIERDPVHARWAEGPHARLQGRFPAGESWSESPVLLEEINAISEQAMVIQLAGGEPTINRTLVAWLEQLCRAGRAPEIDLELVTNLTVVPDPLFQTLSRFRSVVLKVSVDGFGASYEYNRFPGRWATFQRNIERIRQLPNLANLILFPVLNVYNTLTMVDLLEWAEARELQVCATIVRAADHVDCRLLPPEARREARERVAAFFAGRQASGQPLPPRLLSLQQEFQAAFQEIEDTDYDPPTRRREVAHFMQFTNDLDASRGTSFGATCPGTLAHFLAADGPWDPSHRHYPAATPVAPRSPHA